MTGDSPGAPRGPALDADAGIHAGPLFYVVAAVVLVLDQITKIRIAGSMSLHESRPILGDFFRLTYVHNDGAAFGLDLGGRWAFIVVTILVSAFIVFYYARSERAPVARWALAMILGGALGNLADRIRLGEVIDFLHVSVAGFSWPIFNVADIGVSVGVGLLALHLFRKENPQDVDEAPGTDPAADRPDPAGSGRAA
jgi:signal peptidase II